MVNNRNAALAELREWAGNEPRPESNDTETSCEATPCLSQRQASKLFDLAKSIKGNPLPEHAIPNIPR